MIEVSARHWFLATVMAAVAHAALLLLFWEPAPAGAVGAGVGGIEISLGPAGGAPGAAGPVTDIPAATPVDVAAVPPEMVEAVDVPKPAAPVDVVQPVEMAEAEPAEAIDSADVAETVPVEEVEPPSAPVLAEMALGDVAEAEPADVVDAAEPVEMVEPPEPRIDSRPPPPPPKPPAPAAVRPQVQMAEVPPAAEPGQAAALPPPVQGQGGRSGADQAPAAGAGDATAGGGSPGATADYQTLLQRWLEQHKDYPRRAQRRRQEGTALLRFTMDRQGRVLAYDIQRSSGHDLLDREVIAMIERAQPLPPPPPELGQALIEIVVPVEFLLP